MRMPCRFGVCIAPAAPAWPVERLSHSLPASAVHLRLQSARWFVAAAPTDGAVCQMPPPLLPARSAVQVRAANINTEELLIKAQRVRARLSPLVACSRLWPRLGGGVGVSTANRRLCWPSPADVGHPGEQAGGGGLLRGPAGGPVLCGEPDPPAGAEPGAFAVKGGVHRAQPPKPRFSTPLTRLPPHLLPRLDPQVIGFPLELLGVMSAGALALRYTVEGVDPATDLAKVQATLADTLPGLK